METLRGRSETCPYLYAPANLAAVKSVGSSGLADCRRLRWGRRAASPPRLGLALLALLLLFPFGVMAGTGTAQAQSPEPAGSETPYDEAEAQAIDQMLICPVCPAESIDQAQVPLARQMRQKVREMLAAGATRREVLDYFADRYGPDVLAAPPKSGLNLLAWLLPLAGLLAALVAGGLVVKAMTGGKRAPLAEGATAASDGSLAAADAAELEPYLALVDQSLPPSFPPPATKPATKEETDSANAGPKTTEPNP